MKKKCRNGSPVKFFSKKLPFWARALLDAFRTCLPATLSVVCLPLNPRGIGSEPSLPPLSECWSVVVSGRWSEGELKKSSSDASFSVPSALRAGVSDSILNGKLRRQMSCWCRKSNKVWKTADAADQWFWTPIFEGLPWGINYFYTVVLHIKLQKKYQQKVRFEPVWTRFSKFWKL